MLRTIYSSCFPVFYRFRKYFPFCTGHVLFLIVLLILSGTLYADSFAVYETNNRDIESVRSELNAVMSEFNGNGYERAEETFGFSYAYSSYFFSPYDYFILLGKVSERKPVTMLRIEGNDGDVNAISQILAQKGIINYEYKNPFAKAQTLEEKSHFYGQGLNLLFPWAGVIYSAYDSPMLTSGQAWFRGITYFLVDSFLIWAAGRNWFQDAWDPSKYGGNIAAVMVTTRLIGAFQTAQFVRGHNRYARLGYTFYLD